MSNYLLGHILSLKAGTDYKTLAVTRICGPLKKERLGVVVLSNSTNEIDAIGLHLLESKYELAE